MEMGRKLRMRYGHNSGAKYSRVGMMVRGAPVLVRRSREKETSNSFLRFLTASRIVDTKKKVKKISRSPERDLRANQGEEIMARALETPTDL